MFVQVTSPFIASFTFPLGFDNGLTTQHGPWLPSRHPSLDEESVARYRPRGQIWQPRGLLARDLVIVSSLSHVLRWHGQAQYCTLIPRPRVLYARPIRLYNRPRHGRLQQPVAPCILKNERAIARQPATGHLFNTSALPLTCPGRLQTATCMGPSDAARHRCKPSKG